ncbi:MAG: hypothetical protein R6W90_15560 [Ignavibacteriaceae bacterium]
MDEKTALEELQFIRQVIEETKRDFIYNGLDYILWGVIVITGMMLQYILILSKVHFSFFWLWVALISLGWILSFFNGRKLKNKAPHGYHKKIVMHVWLASGIAMTLIGFLGPASGAISPMAISPLISVVVGSAYFISGNITKSKWFTNLSFGWWGGAIIMFFVMNVHQFLIMAILMIFFQTIPGIILYKKYKKEIAVA